MSLIQNENEKDQRLPRLQKDVSEIEQKFADMVFWEGESDTSKLTDEEWSQNEKNRELQMKKLMTVTKSKYYMLKVNYNKIFTQVDYE